MTQNFRTTAFYSLIALAGLFFGPHSAFADQCNWRGTVYELCPTQQKGWGTASGQPCVGVKSCSAQRAPWGVVKSPPPVVSTNICVPYLASETVIPAGWKLEVAYTSLGQLYYRLVSDAAAPASITPAGWTIQCQVNSEEGTRFPLVVPPPVGEKVVAVGEACGFVGTDGVLRTCADFAQCLSAASNQPAYCRVTSSPPAPTPPPINGNLPPVCGPGISTISYAPAGWRFEFGTPVNGSPRPLLVPDLQAPVKPLPAGYFIQCQTTSDGERFPFFIVP